MKKEIDPNDIDQHEPGAKLDEGKILAGVLGDFSKALKAVAEVGTFGAKKYSRGGWKHVNNGIKRYTDALWRHLLDENIEENDKDSGLKHAAHLAWNSLARLELILSGKTKKTCDLMMDGIIYTCEYVKEARDGVIYKLPTGQDLFVYKHGQTIKIPKEEDEERPKK